MSTTLNDIAREANTSVSTVSRVLAGGPMANRISEETRQKITETANRLGYRPNLLARSLRTRKSHTVALLVSDIANPWFGQLASLIEQSLHRRGYSLMLCNSGEDLKREEEYLKLLPRKGIDGLILVPLATTKKALVDFLPANLPIVLVDRPIPGIAASVTSDSEDLAGGLCVALHAAGVKKVCLVTGPSHVVTHRRRAEIVAERFQIVDRFEGPAQIETGRNAMLHFEPKRSRPDAIVCTNNFLFQGVMEAIESVENPPILGVFDDVVMMNLLPFPIVASMQDIPMLAERAVEQMMKILDGKIAEISPIELPARVVTNKAFQKLTGR